MIENLEIKLGFLVGTKKAEVDEIRRNCIESKMESRQVLKTSNSGMLVTGDEIFKVGIAILEDVLVVKVEQSILEVIVGLGRV